MGIVGREIEQTRVWIDPTAPAPPNLNYKEVFPITVFDAVRAEMNNSNSITLTKVIEDIYAKLNEKQQVFPAKSANYLMTYAGTAGAIGSIMISTEIPWEPAKQSHEKIPTEKAVGVLMQKLGLVNEDGTIADPESRKVRWSDIIGRPLIYEELGINVDGFITQRGVTEAIDKIKAEMAQHEEDSIGAVQSAIQRLDDHASNKNNPHSVTIGQIGAVGREEFDFHTQTQVNPHGITAEMIGLGKVNNTTDLDKPISIATQEALDRINEEISKLDDELDDLSFIVDITYTQSSGKLAMIYRDGTEKSVLIPIDGLVDEIRYDIESKDLVIYELSGEEKRVSLEDLWVRYTGSVGQHITVEIGNIGSTPGPENDLINITKNEVKNLWDNGEHPDGEIFDGDSHNMSEITEEETDSMWYDGVMPEESGNIIGITLEEITQNEAIAMWESGTLPDEGSSYDSSSEEINKPGVKIIKAYINPYSITDLEIDDDAVTSRIIRNQSVTTEKLVDKSVTAAKLADGVVSSDKIGKYTIVNTNIADRSINGRTLMSSAVNNRILAVLEHGTDPIWTQINSEMIKSSVILTSHLIKAAVTTEKIADDAVTTDKIENDAIVTDKIKDRAVTMVKIALDSIDSLRIIENVNLRGTPTTEVRPSVNSDNHEIPDTAWVNKRVNENVNGNNNYADRSVDGRVLFSSPVRHRVLVTLRANSDPVWDQVDHEMLADDAVDNNNIVDAAVDSDKIKDSSIYNRHLTANAVKNINIMEDAVTSTKLWRSNGSNMVLATVDDNAHPIYTKVSRAMIENAAISTMQIEDGSVTPSKIESSPEEYRVLGVGFKNTQPMWTRIYNAMINDRAIDGRTLMSSAFQDTVLGVGVAGTDPYYQKINSRMIEEDAIKREHIGEGEIWQEHLQEKIIESRHILDWTIQQNNIAPRAITGTELFTSPYPDRVLAVTTAPYANPAWMQVTTGMIEDKAVTSAKLFQSDLPYRVLAVTQAGVPPEYIMITGQFIVDDSITPAKLTRDFALYGTPTMTVHPDESSDSHQIASTHWVRNTIAEMINNIDDPEWFRIQYDMIPDHIIDGTKLFRSIYDGPRLLGVTKAGEDPEYLLVEEQMIADSSVTTNKIQRDLHLLGSPVLDVRPSPTASTAAGGGDLIPDCQWVLDRIDEHYSSDATPGDSGSVTTPVVGDVADGSVSTVKLMDRSVTGRKLFTSTVANRILAVLDPNTDPTYTQLINVMIANRQIDGRVLMSSEVDNTILAVAKAGSDPVWTKIIHSMMGDDSIGTEQIIDEAVTTEKLANKSVTRDKVADEAIIDEMNILDNAVTAQKIRDDSVVTSKIKDKSVTSEKLQDSIVLHGTPTVDRVPVGIKAIHNITVSPDLPTDEDGEDGDIWITYI